MNHISISYEWLKTTADIRINGEPLDILNEDLSTLRREFRVFAPSLFQILDQYFESEYTLDFHGTDYQCECVSRLAVTSKRCAGVDCSRYLIPFKYQELYTGLLYLGDKNGCADRARLPLDVVSLCDCAADNADKMIKVRRSGDEKPCDVLVFDPNNVPETLNGEVLVCPSEDFALYKTGDKYVFAVPEDMINGFLEYYCLNDILIPYASGIVKRVSRLELDKRDEMIFNGIVKLTPQVILDFPQTLDVGESKPCAMYVFPEGYKGFCFRVSEENALSFDGMNVRALIPGEFTVSVENTAGKTVLTQNVTVSAHSYVSEIKLVPNFTYLYENEEGQISAYLVPANAEDAGNLQWTTSDVNVAHVSGNGHVVAFRSGRCTLTASTKNASAQLIVDVLVRPLGFNLTPINASIKSTQKVELTCTPVPENAYTGPITWSTSSGDAGKLVVSPNGRKCTFYPNKDRSVSCGISCSVDQLGTKTCAVASKGPKSRNFMFALTLISSIVGIILLTMFGLLSADGMFRELFYNAAADVVLVLSVMLLPLLLSFFGMFSRRKGRFIAWFVIDVIHVIFWLTIILSMATNVIV